MRLTWSDLKDAVNLTGSVASFAGVTVLYFVGQGRSLADMATKVPITSIAVLLSLGIVGITLAGFQLTLGVLGDKLGSFGTFNPWCFGLAIAFAIDATALFAIWLLAVEMISARF